MGLPLPVAPSDEGGCEAVVADTYDCVCICPHAECESLRRRCWCRHWLIVKWVTKQYLDPAAFIGKIRDCLRYGNPFRRWGSFGTDRVGNYHCCALLFSDPAGPGFGDTQIGRLQNPEGCDLGVCFVHNASSVQEFRCCRQYRQYMRTLVPDRIAAMRGLPRWPELPPFLFFGDESIVQELEGWMQLDDVRSGGVSP